MIDRIHVVFGHLNHHGDGPCCGYAQTRERLHAKSIGLEV